MMATVMEKAMEVPAGGDGGGGKATKQGSLRGASDGEGVRWLKYSTPMPAFRRVEDVPLVVRLARRSRDEVRAQYGIAPDAKVVIFNFGGQKTGWALKEEFVELIENDLLNSVIESKSEECDKD